MKSSLVACYVFSVMLRICCIEEIFKVVGVFSDFVLEDLWLCIWANQFILIIFYDLRYRSKFFLLVY